MAEAEPAEPRFAGAVRYGYVAPPPRQPDGFSADLPPDPSGPVVSYGPSPPSEPAPDSTSVAGFPTWAAALIAASGGLLAAIASLLTWATLELTPGGSDATSLTSGTSRIGYQGLSLLEGRVALALGVVAIVLSVLVVARRMGEKPAVAALIATGALGVVVTAFAAIGHPAELSTLFQSYLHIQSVTVSLPNGVGVWLSLFGSVLILIGGLAGRQGLNR